MRLNKKAVSPLIATVLLVMIVVSIGAAVMVVIQGLTEEQLQATEVQSQVIKCANDVSVGIFTESDSYMMCMDSPSASDDLGNFSIYMENKGLKDITDWRVTVIGASGVNDTNGGFVALSKNQLKLFKFNWTGTGTPSKLRIAPKTAGGGGSGPVTCEEPNLIWDSDFLTDLDDCDDVTWDDRNADS
ncbi:hypothetical protein JXC34_01645 [Candidatus Woesearchaeota archaeon]|nr:hypothetical protein [Candidatus Woesearchaeota archaeon]